MLASMVTTAPSLPGYTITRNLGVVRGITVRSRAETYQLMCREASALGANAIIAMRYDATELMAGLTEVLCYGTAVMVQRDREDGVAEMALHAIER